MEKNQVQAGKHVHYKNKKGECQDASVTRVIDREEGIVQLELAQAAEHQNAEYLVRENVPFGTDYKTWHYLEPELESADDDGEEEADDEA